MIGSFRVHLLAHRLGEFPVDLLIVSPVVGAKDGPGVGQMAQRPQPLVREAVVVPSFFLLGKPDTAQRVGLGARWYANVATRIHRLAVGRAAAVGDPHAGTSTHYRLDRRDQTARWMLNHDGLVRTVHMDVRLTIGDDYDALAVQVAAQRIVQPLGCPRTSLMLENTVVEFAHVAQDGIEFRSFNAIAPQQEPQRCAPTVPVQPRRDERDDRRGEAEYTERKPQEISCLVFAPSHKTHVVHEYDETERRVGLDHRNGAEVDAARRQRSDRMPGGP